MLDVVQRGGANLQPLLVLVVPMGGAGVEIPAVVVEAGRVRRLPDVVEGLALELAEPDHDVRDLHARVVDVVLHLDGDAAKPLDTHQRVSQRRVPEVADVCSLVGIDGRVLDDRLRRWSMVNGRWAMVGQAMVGRQERACERGAIQIDVEISVRGGLDPADPFDGPERACQLLRDGTGRLTQAPRELERDRRCEIAKLALGRTLNRQ